jgi:thiamine kinase-like enzyme
MEERLAAALALVPGCAAASAARIPGGITNQSYRVDVGGHPCVLRLDGKSAVTLGIDRQNELVALRAMAGLGIGAQIVFSDVAAGVLVTRVVPGKALEPHDLRQASTAERVARLVRRVHEGPSFAGVLSPFAVVRDYRQKAAALGTVVGEAERALEIMASVEQCLGEAGPLRPCHNDLLAANLLIDGADLHLIDWEYAAMGDPVFDVANFVTNLQLADADAEQLFEAYLGLPSSEAERARLALLRFMSDLREAFWGVLQSAQSDLDFDFRAYAAHHLSRALSYADSTRFAHALSFSKGQAGA